MEYIVVLVTSYFSYLASAEGALVDRISKSPIKLNWYT
jgi:hypothetical protein